MIKRYEVACFSLLASAFVLAGLLMIQLQNHAVLSSAQAEMVLNRGNITLMTAQTRPNEEAVFVLENTTAKLLVYRVDSVRKRIDLVRNTDLKPWLRAAAAATPATGGAGRVAR